MKIVVKTLLFSMLFWGIGMPVQANSCRWWSEMRRIERRIDRGIERGRLTRGERRILRRQKRRVRRTARRLHEDDGYLSRRDCRIIHSKLDRLSDMVRRFKHNRRSYDNYDRGRHNDRRHY